MDIVDKTYWDKSYKDVVFKKHDTNDAIYKFIRKYIPKAVTEKNCLEIGSFPGTYLSELGELGYTLNGVDFNEKNTNELPQWLKSKGLNVGNFYSGDFRNVAINNQFDLVASFGFIEHFTNFLEIITLHDKYVKLGGYLIITTPNYRGLFRNLIYKILAPENYKKHYTPSMKPEKWASHLKSLNYKIIFKGYFGGYSIWIDYEKRNWFQKIMLYLALRIVPRLGKIIPFESHHWSKNCGIVAVKA